jgi:N-acetylmuramoyl-L-alanine amidase
MAQRATISPDYIAGFEKTLTENTHPDFDIKKVLFDRGKKDLVIQVNKVTRKKGDNQYYVPEETKKQRIVLHYTMGQIEGDLSTLTSDKLVSVSYVIGRDGMIYYLFNTQYWSFHLGRGSVGGNTEQSPLSIGIELSNVGPLTKVGEEYFMRVKTKEGYKDLFYCTVAQKHLYQILEKPFKGANVYATFPEAQYDALIRLLRYLTALWGIPRAFLPEADRFKTTEKVLSFKGIVTHVNYRPEDKSDIGPAFDWKKVIAGVTADTYQSTQSTDRGLEKIRVVKSEKGIRSTKGAARGAVTEPEED